MVDRITLGKMTHPVRGFLHGSAAIVSVAGLTLLLWRSWGDTPKVLSMAVFGVSLIALYTTSALYHSVPWRERWEARMQRLDHSMIFLLVAGTYTPVAFNVLHGTWRLLTLAVVWGIAIIGIFQKILVPRLSGAVSITLQMIMGWFAIVPFLELVERLSNGAIALMVAGGLSYTVGMIFMVSRWPRLFPRIFSSHEVFHVLVVAGSVFHFLMILWYVVPFDRV